MLARLRLVHSGNGPPAFMLHGVAQATGEAAAAPPQEEEVGAFASLLTWGKQVPPRRDRFVALAVVLTWPPRCRVAGARA